MTKKLFYTDPLAAIYMAREFGVKFIDAEKLVYDDGDINYFFDIFANVDDVINAYTKEHYIHPDSYDIFEPQKDDLVDLGDHGFAFVTERKGNNINCALFHIENCAWKDGYWHRRWVPIIQRNNKPFFTPESEEQ